MLTDEESGVKQWSICEEEEGACKNIQRVPQKSKTSTWMAPIMDVFKMRFLGDFRGNSESMNMAVRCVALEKA